MFRIEKVLFACLCTCCNVPEVARANVFIPLCVCAQSTYKIN